MISSTCPVVMFILSQTKIRLFLFPSKHLGRIVRGLCFSQINVSSIRRIRMYNHRGPARVNSDNRHGPKSSDST